MPGEFFLQAVYTRCTVIIHAIKKALKSFTQSQEVKPKLLDGEKEGQAMSKAAKIQEIANRLGTDPRWLDALINFETAGTYSPTIQNPRSSARGLIQVIDKTAQDEFNATDSLTLVNTYPTFESQMENVVYPYLAKYAPFATKQELYMSVFYPKYRKVDPDTVFPENVQKANPGIVTVQDYVDFVDRRVKQDKLVLGKGAVNIGIILIAGVVGYFLMRRNGMI